MQLAKGIEKEGFDWHYVFTAQYLQFVNTDVMILNLGKVERDSKHSFVLNEGLCEAEVVAV